jgi:hypothetical protein
MQYLVPTQPYANAVIVNRVKNALHAFRPLCLIRFIDIIHRLARQLAPLRAEEAFCCLVPANFLLRFEGSLRLGKEALDTGINQVTCRMWFQLANIGSQIFETWLEYRVAAALKEVRSCFL